MGVRQMPGSKLDMTGSIEYKSTDNQLWLYLFYYCSVYRFNLSIESEHRGQARSLALSMNPLIRGTA